MELRLMADAPEDALPLPPEEPGEPPAAGAIVEATFSAAGDLGLEFAFPFITSIDPDGAAAAVPGLRPGLMLRDIETQLQG